MRIKDRVINLFLRPSKEWHAISEEHFTLGQFSVRYMIPLMLIPLFSLVIGYGLVGKTSNDGFISLAIKGWDIGIQKALIYLFTMPITVFLSALAIDYLAPVFRSSRNLERTVTLLGYATTPVLLSGVFSLVPILGFMFLLGIVAAFALLWFGIPVLKSTPKASVSAYFLAMVIVTMSILALVHLIIKTLLGAIWVNESALYFGAFMG